MPLSSYDMQDLQQVLWVKVEGTERRTRLDVFKRTSKTSILSEVDDEEMTLPDPEIPVYTPFSMSRRVARYWEDELPPETMGRMKKQEKGKSNLHAKEDFAEKLKSMNVGLRLSKLIQKYEEDFGALTHPCFVQSWSTWTTKSNQSLKGLW